VNESEVARYLHEHPGFFQEHESLLAEIVLPDPRTGNAVSLIERQAQIQRERIRALELQLADFVRNARANDDLAQRIVRWACLLLSEPERARRIDAAPVLLQTVFSVPSAALHLWDETGSGERLALRDFAEALRGPRCGPAATLLEAGGPDTGVGRPVSVALVPLRRLAGARTFGMLVLGSDDPSRFEDGLGTALLERIGELLAAAIAPAETAT